MSGQGPDKDSVADFFPFAGRCRPLRGRFFLKAGEGRALFLCADSCQRKSGGAGGFGVFGENLLKKVSARGPGQRPESNDCLLHGRKASVALCVAGICLKENERGSLMRLPRKTVRRSELQKYQQ